MIKVVGYTRVSSDEQAAKDLSIPAQIKAINRYVDDKDDLILSEMFKDEGVSAYASADKRPGFMSMINLVKDTDISVILVHKLDRFSRNREESIIFKSLLKKHGVRVKSITENFDPDTPSGFLFEGMIEVINQFYSMNLAMETRKGMVENTTRGYWNGGTVPYGYKVVEVPGNGDRVHKKFALGDPVEVATVRLIFDLAVNNGMGAKSIATKLEKDGVLYRNDKSWIKQRIGYILNNNIYYGATVWNRTHTKTRTLKPEKEWIITENMHEPIVSKEMFMKRKEMAEEQKGKRFRASAIKTEWLLAKLIRCGDCHSAYVGVRRKRVGRNSNGKYQYYLCRYVCSGHINHGKKKCESFYIDQEYLENSVIKLIRDEITRPKRLREIEESIKQQLANLQKEKDNSYGLYQNKLNEIKIGIDRFYDAIASGLDPDICKEKIGKLMKQKDLLEKELDGKDSNLKVAESLERDLSVCRKLAKNFNKEFMSLPFEKRRMLIVHFVERIDIIDHAVARIILRIPKLTPGRTLKPPMAKKSRKEMSLESGKKATNKSKKTSPESNQVRSVRLPAWS